MSFGIDESTWYSLYDFELKPIRLYFFATTQMRMKIANKKKGGGPPLSFLNSTYNSVMYFSV